MWQNARYAMDNLLDGSNSWSRELASILPLSSLIDFIHVPVKLHLLQLCSSVPMWSWAVTPASARTLLSAPPPGPSCYLDRFGQSQVLECIDGRYGDRYYAANPETLRLCLGSQQQVHIQNKHENMTSQGPHKRPQWLEVVHVSRKDASSKKGFKDDQCILYNLVAFSGWFLAVGGVIVAGILQLYLAMGFLLAVILTGTMIFWMHGGAPRKLLVNYASPYQRLVVAASHMNETSWYLFIGESTFVNAILNRALTQETHQEHRNSPLVRLALSVFIGGQWTCAIGAAASKDWNSYLITFWIVICIITHACLFPPSTAVAQWMSDTAEINMTRYATELSSRRALLNTILAMNPDSIDPSDPTKFKEEALSVLNPILAPGQSRSEWEQASLQAMNEVSAQNIVPDDVLSGLGGAKHISQKWKDCYGSQYWSTYILEGIYIAAKLNEVVNPGQS